MKPKTTIFLLVNGISIFIIFSFLFMMNKGFSISASDEGFYMLNQDKNQELGKTITYFGLLFKKFDFSIITLRFIRLILTLISCCVFSTGIYIYLKKNKKNISHLGILVSVVNLLLLYTFIWGPKTLSYNHISNSFCFIIIGLLFWSFNLKRAEFVFLLIGSSLYFIFISKFTTSLLFFGLILILQFIEFNKISPVQKVINISILISGFLITSFLFYNYSGMSFFEIQRNISDVASQINNANKDSHIFFIFKIQIEIVVKTLEILSICILLFFPLFHFLFKKKSNTLKFVGLFYFIACYLFILWIMGGEKIIPIAFSKDGFLKFIDNLYIGAPIYILILIYLGLLIYNSLKTSTFPKNILISFVCILFSFGILFGSDNYFLNNITFVLAPLTFSLILMTDEMVINKYASFIKPYFSILIFSIFLSFSFFYTLMVAYQFLRL